MPEKIRFSSDRHPVAMATGVIDRSKIGQPQKQVLVIVTSVWSVICFDHNAHRREIAISASNYTLWQGDSGLIIIGGRMEIQPYICLDPLAGIRMAEQNAE